MSAPAAELVDTHCHLVLLEERGLLVQALESAEQAGVTQIVSIGLDVDDSDRNRQMAERYPQVWFTVGWHPHTKTAPDAAQLAALGELLRHPRAVGVGEIGLDYFWRPGYHEVPVEVQKRSLRSMLELAQAHAKPVVVHDRDAHADVVAELEEGLGSGRDGDAPAGVLHCFSGDAALAAQAVRLRMVCSFAGTVTFPHTEALREAAVWLPEGSVVVETDAPFLAPVPYRGQPNLPGYVAATAAAVAALRGRSSLDFAAETTATARALFDLPVTAGQAAR